MKNKRFWAALLCAAMIFTSQSFNVSAAMQESLLTDEGTSMAVEADEISESLTDAEEVPAAELADEGLLDESLIDDGALADEALLDVDTLTDESELLTEDSEEIVEGGAVISENPEGEEASGCFKTNSIYLELKDGYSDLSNFPTVVIPKKVQIISANSALFKDNRYTKNISFESESELKIIEARAFENSAITSFVAPLGYTTISANTFKGSDIESFTFNNITEIGASAFEDCTKLDAGITGGSFVTRIGEAAFRRAGFTKIDKSTNKNFAGFSNLNITVSANAFEACPYLTTAALPDGFKTISKSCFKDCSLLSRVEIGSKTTKIEENAFEGCVKLSQITFTNIDTVSNNSFVNCKALTELDFPATVTTVGADAFQGCSAIKKVTFNYKNSDGIADEVLSIANSAFTSAVTGITFWGYYGVVKKYADSKGAKFEPLLSKHKVEVNSVLGEKNVRWSFVSGVDKNGYAVNGQTVKFKITPEDGKTFDHGSIVDNKGVATTFEYYGGDMTSQIYTFVMPNRDVEIKGRYVSKSTLAATSTKYSYKIDRYNNNDAFMPDGDKNWKTDSSGNKGILVVTAKDSNNIEYTIGPWMYNYECKSDKDETIALINNKGIITAQAQGTTTITATPVENSPAKKIEFKLTVGATVQIANIGFAADAAVFPNPSYGRSELGTPRVFDDNDKPDPLKMPIIIKYNKTDLNSSDQTFKLNVKLTSIANKDAFAKVTWKSANDSLVKLENASNYDNCNTITVKKGAEGEILITASVTGYKTDETTKKKEVLNAYAIVKIIDETPRVTTTEVKVNKRRDNKNDDLRGTQISIIPAETKVGTMEEAVFKALDETLYYDNGEIFDVYKGIRIMFDNTVVPNPDANGRYYYRIYFSTDASGDSGNSTLDAIKEGQSKTFSGKSKLYIRGKYKATDSEYFYIPIQKLVVYNEKLKPTITMSGDINLFYNSLCYPVGDPETIRNEIDDRAWKEIMGDDAKRDNVDDIQTFVKKTINQIAVSQSIQESTAEVDYNRTTLYTVETYNRYKLNEDITKLPAVVNEDEFDNNFDVIKNKDNPNGFLIRRTGNEIKKKNAKEVTSGYLFIYYKGYTKPSPVKINLQVKNVKPSYVLSETKVKANNNNSGSTFKFKVLTKDKKDTAVLNSDLYIDNTVNPVKQGLNVVAGKSTPNVFKELTNASMANNGTITLEVQNSLPTGNSKAVISVQKKHWYRTIEYTYNISTTGAAPKARMLKSKVYLNSNMKCNNGDKGSGNVTMALDQSDCTAGIKSIENLGGVSNITTQFTADPDFPNKVNINFAIKDAVQKGTYKFKIIPTAKYSGGQESELKEVYVSVVVSEKSPGLSLARTAYVFNVDYPDKEIYTARIKSYKNIPSSIIGQNPDIDALKAMDIDKTGITVKYAGNAKNQVKGDAIAGALKADISDIQYDKKTRKYYYNVTLKLKTKVTSEAFSLPFTIEGVKINGALIAPCKITVKGKSVEPKVVLKASGKINTADPTSFITYKFSMKDLVDPEIKPTATVYEDGKVSTQFYLEPDPDHFKKDDMRWKLKAIHHDKLPFEEGYDHTFRSGTHTLSFEFTLDNTTPEKKFRKDKIKVTPKQSLSKLKAKPDNTSFYAGTSELNRTTTVELYKTSELKTLITGVKLSNSNSAEVKKAFRVVGYNNQNNTAGWRDQIKKNQKTLKAGTVDIMCYNPSVLKAGKTYTLILETQTDGQFYKWDADKKIVKDAKGNEVNTTGSTVKIKVVVYN